MKIFHFILVSLLFIPIAYSKGDTRPMFVEGSRSLNLKQKSPLPRPCFNFFIKSSNIFQKSQPVVRSWGLRYIWTLSNKELESLRPHQLVLLKPHPAGYILTLYSKGGINLTNEQKMALVQANPSAVKKIWEDKESQIAYELDYLTVNVIQGITGKLMVAKNDSMAAKNAFHFAVEAFRKAYFFGSGKEGRNGKPAIQNNFTDAQLKEKIGILKGHFLAENISLLIQDRHLTKKMINEVLQKQTGAVSPESTETGGTTQTAKDGMRKAGQVVQAKAGEFGRGAKEWLTKSERPEPGAAEKKEEPAKPDVKDEAAASKPPSSTNLAKAAGDLAKTVKDGAGRAGQVVQAKAGEFGRGAKEWLTKSERPEPGAAEKKEEPAKPDVKDEAAASKPPSSTNLAKAAGDLAKTVKDGAGRAGQVVQAKAGEFGRGAKEWLAKSERPGAAEKKEEPAKPDVKNEAAEVDPNQTELNLDPMPPTKEESQEKAAAPPAAQVTTMNEDNKAMEEKKRVGDPSQARRRRPPRD